MKNICKYEKIFVMITDIDIAFTHRNKSGL